MRSRLHWVRPPGLVLAGFGVLAFSVVHALLEVGRIASAANTPRLLVAVAATLVFLPLHLRHLRFGMRAQRPPGGAITLSLMAIAQLVGLVAVGPSWLLMLGALGCSALIVLPAPWSLAAVAGCVLCPEAMASLGGLHGLFGPEQFSWRDSFNFGYDVLALALGQFALVWLLAAAHELKLSRGALARAAAEYERRRVQAHVQTALSRSLAVMLATGRRARAAAMLDSGVAAPLVMLDRLLELSHGALADLRRVVADARTPVGDSATTGLVQAARDGRTPVGRALTVPRARFACWAQYALWGAFTPLLALGAFGPLPGRSSIPVTLGAWVALAGLQVWLLVDVMRGERPRFATARWLLMLALAVGALPAGGIAWEDSAYIVAAAAAVSFTGYRRVLPTLVAATVVAVYEGLVVLPLFPPASAFVSTVDIAASFVLWLFVAPTLAASALLVPLLGRLEEVRGQLAAHASNAERRRLSSDLHDIVGQSLTAISLKASVARELLVSGDRAAAGSEIDGVLLLTVAQSVELDAIMRDQRRVELRTELDEAIGLLRDAGIEVNVTAELEGLDDRTSSLLGWALREGTTNVLRHTDARLCEIVLERSDRHIQLELRNDGAPAARGVGTGLAGLTERFAAADGTAHAQGLPDGGFVLRVELPA